MPEETAGLSIGEVSARTGVAASALRFYESEGLISSSRTAGNQRRFPRGMLRRVAVIRAGQAAGIPLARIREQLETLPDERTPTKRDWERFAQTWRAELEARMRRLEQLRDRLTSCIGCGCLSLSQCGLLNPDDRAAALGSGPRYLLGDEPEPRV